MNLWNSPLELHYMLYNTWMTYTFPTDPGNTMYLGCGIGKIWGYKGSYNQTLPNGPPLLLCGSWPGATHSLRTPPPTAYSAGHQNLPCLTRGYPITRTPTHHTRHTASFAGTPGPNVIPQGNTLCRLLSSICRFLAHWRVYMGTSPMGSWGLGFRYLACHTQVDHIRL